MKLATYKGPKGLGYGVVTDKGIVDLASRLGAKYPDLKALLAGDALDEARKTVAGAVPDFQTSQLQWLPVIPNPGKIICVGLNYADHVAETGRDNTENPALFIRLADSQVGHDQPMLRPRESVRFDFEAEIAVIIGKSGRRVSEAESWKLVAGYSCYNDGSVRDWQRHTVQWTAGKNFVKTGPFGPWMVSSDDIPPDAVMSLESRLNGQVMQKTTTDYMIFKIPRLINYISTFTTLEPGDVIVTGTPGGVGDRRTPPVYMKAGDTIEIVVDRIGTLRNTVADD